MKKINLSQLFIFLAGLFVLSGCEVIGGIFEAGMWVGVTIVVIVLILIIWLLKKIF